MEIPQSIDEAPASWDWGNLLDFNVDDQLDISWYTGDQPMVAPVSLPASVLSSEPSIDGSSDGSDRVRKRDPRLTCSNFLAGRIPCACPELDEKEEQEEEGGRVGKKRPRTSSAAMARCQIPGCGADISELKGYHQRHRVCLRCASANAVVLNGHSKRYCQQCGKFHILSDFDEDKRSCRRKLEKHNDRRRRKSTGVRNAVEGEPQGDLIARDVPCDGEAEKDSLCLSNQTTEGETLLESEDGHLSPSSSAPDSQNVRHDHVVSFVASRETQMDGKKENSKHARSSSLCDNKSSYSSLCPTGRISFKLYDWNPAEFPRRLRHQIFQWLSSMPVELEGYIRPGCTILTIFVAMPRLMWEKLSEEASSYLHGLVTEPDSMLLGKGTIIVNLNNMIFRVLKDGSLVMNVKGKLMTPRLHYVHPNFFEAGKPMEFFACGSNLLQAKFRFLVSFAGKYLEYDYCLENPHLKTEGYTAQSSDHQMLKIYVSHTEPKLFGPAFIEVENESGLSNFIPVLFGNKEICSEMQIVQHKLEESLCSKRNQFAFVDSPSYSCEDSMLRQMAMSEFLLDVAWLLKKPKLDDIERHFTTTQLERFNCLLNILIQNKSTAILEKVLESIEVVMDKFECKTDNSDLKLFVKYMDHAREIVHQRFHHGGVLALRMENSVIQGDYFSQKSAKNDMILTVLNTKDMERIEEGKLEEKASPAFQDSSETVPLLNKEVVMNVNHRKEWPRKSCGRFLTSSIMISRPYVLLAATAALCFGICTILLHPDRVGEFAITVRRCLFNYSK